MIDLTPFEPTRENGCFLTYNKYRYLLEINDVSRERYFFVTGINSKLVQKGCGYRRNKPGVPYDIMFNEVPLFHNEVVRAVQIGIKDGGKKIEKLRTVEKMREGYQSDIHMDHVDNRIASTFWLRFGTKEKGQLSFKTVVNDENVMKEEINLEELFINSEKVTMSYKAPDDKSVIHPAFILSCLNKYTSNWRGRKRGNMEFKRMNRFQMIRNFHAA